MSFAITPLYAGILALLYILLSLRVVKTRVNVRVSIGDGEDRSLLRAVRVHSNFAEYAPFTLLLLGFGELMAAPWWSLHALGMALLAGRVLHAAGLGREPDQFTLRRYGMYLTSVALIGAAIQCIVFSLLRLTDGI